ncbi:unnamed protein product [Phytophthora lilii]|uniref:Unnamed protein product n=1 Tax=Phytophthora lilii TaxID=2077276 RepID=A0A9W6XAE6_9STRA|nr:unnamed protein product [Phytophthora lilii]
MANATSQFAAMPSTQDEVETLEAALSFIAQYEAPQSPLAAVNATGAFKRSQLHKAHSLEVPEVRSLSHSHSLELPEEDAVLASAAVDALLDDLKVEGELFDAHEMQQLVDVAVRSAVSPPICAQSTSPTSSQTRRRRLSKREEICELRDTVAELSQQLDQLQASSTPSSPAEEEVHVGSILAQPESLWQQVAARQLLLRQKAEQTNAHLRSLVETRVRQTKNLKRMLNRRNDSERRKHVHIHGPPPKDNDAVFAKLLQGTDELYVGLDKLFMDKGMPQVPCPGRKRQVHRDAVNGALVVFLDKNQVPFDLEKTEKAVWKLLTRRHRKDSPYAQNGDTVSNFVSFNCVAADVSVVLQVREVARKYVTDERAVFICRSVMEPTPSGKNAELGLKFHETMTVVVRRGDPLSCGQETTVIESYLCATRHDEGNDVARKYRGDVYVDIAIEGWERSLASNNQDIENLLFDEAIQVAAMACANADEVANLQATLEFISSYELSSSGFVSSDVAMLDMMEERELLALAGDLDLDQSSEDNFSQNQFSRVSSTQLDTKRSDQLSPCTSQDDVSSIVGGPVRPGTQPNKRRRKGAPRKEEIADLRKLAAQLSNKLKSLQTSAAKLEEAESKQTSVSTALTKSLWKGIATRQRTLRKETEQENMKLRNEVKFQAKYAKNLKRMLKRRYNEEVKALSEMLTPLGAEIEQIFTELLKATEGISTGVGELFTKKGMANLSCPGLSQQAYPDTVSGLFLELMSKNQVPFSPQQTVVSAWKALCGGKTREWEIKVRLLPWITCRAAGNETDDSTYRRSLGVLGLLSQETVVIVVRKGQALASGQETTIIESYLKVTRSDDGKKTAVKFRDAVFVDGAIKGWSDKLSNYRDRVENILFEACLTST